jgi:mRNA interferase RelE/StbE
MFYQIKMSDVVFDLIPSFHPDLKKLLKEALKDLKKNPNLGKFLKAELSGFQSYRLKRYRIIYKTNIKSQTLIVHYIGHRRNVYELFSEMVAQ